MEACKRTDSGRCSPRRRPASINAGLAALVLAGLSFAWEPARCQAEPAAAAPVGGAELLRRFLADTQTLQATFRQQLLGAEREVLEQASGELFIHRPGRFYWRYAEPFEQVVVSDGDTLWIYDAELSQATVTPLAEAAPASPAMLLSGEATLDTEFDVLESFEADGRDWVRLAPKPEGADFREVLIGFRAGVLDRLRLVDSLEQVTTLEFDGVTVNSAIADTLFDFEPPPGVDVIGEAH